MMLEVYRTVIKLSTVHWSITRYTNMLHNKTERESASHPVVCIHLQSNEYSHTLKGVRYREYTSNSTAYEWATTNTRQF